MATLILAAAGQAAGGLFGLGSLGGILGKAAGAIAGSALDQTIFGSSRTVETGRLADLSVQASNEGAALPLVYGRVRLAGQIIWATRFEEEVSDESQGGKGGGGGVNVRSFAYYGNFAVALCEGPVTRISRIWADGKPLDTAQYSIRFYPGSDDHQPDPLMSGLQGECPAYRGTAYVVFERLPLESFGNRIPQLTFEVVRVVEPLEGRIKAVTLIPGAGEFVYQPTPVSATPQPGVSESLNRHVPEATTDWVASLDDLQALCPNLESVALVISWFGDDLRAGQCSIRPKVEESIKITLGGTWAAGGLSRGEADEVSRIDDRPAFGGTPSDASVIAAIQDLKARGLKVMLYPFVLMDVPDGNGLTDPYGGAEQASYPWRGRIAPASDADNEAAAFLGSAVAADFSVSGDTVSYSGSAEWSYRRHILHLAHLAEIAGGVDAFLIGSELRGLTQAQGAGGSYPFVTGLVSLAADVSSVLSGATEISYAADWSEYGVHQAGADELRFPLDPLWASADIDFIGIDNYLPLSDMRANGDPDGNADPYDVAVLKAGIASGEYYDWYYASEADRIAGLRSPISDGTYGKPWVYRAKDLPGWWQNAHYERFAGVEETTPTPWAPRSKPIRFTELGFPAIDKGANQPNVFVDPKSSESALPHFSNGARDDLIQRRALEAQLAFYDETEDDFEESANPVSPFYGGRMLDVARTHLWTWDARPYPAFPNFLDVWSDGANWQVGHWLNGRLGGLTLKGFLEQLLADYGISQADVFVGNISGTLEGVAVAGPVSARQIIEPLLTAFGGTASDRGTQIWLETARESVTAALALADLIDPDGEAPVLSRTRAQESELASEIRISAEDVSSDYRRRVAASRRLEVGSRQIETMDLAAVTSPHVLQQAADRRLARIWGERERAEFSLSPERQDLEPGDVVEISEVPGKSFEPPLKMRIEAIEDTDLRRVEAIRIGSTRAPVSAVPEPFVRPFRSFEAGRPHGVFMDLTPLLDSDPEAPLRLACFASPWPGSLTLLRSATDSGFQPVLEVDSPATVGQLASDLLPGPLGVWDRGNEIEVEIYGGLLQSRPLEAILAGKNVLAIRTSGGGFEVLQFAQADLIGTRHYRLSMLLRGQSGTEPDMLSGAVVGADVVLLDGNAAPLVRASDDQLGLELNYRLAPAGRAIDDPAVLALTHSANGRGALPLAPVHLKARRTSEGIGISFIRQTRRGGDSWEQVEVPLGEANEAYAVDILAPDEAVVRTLTVTTQTALYETAQELSDFGAPTAELSIAVCQLSATAGRGFQRKAIFHV
ncbi:baseplate multidomain protein megatron [Roseibium algae]|uniref:Glycoside hydrolase/phage tail family protein n=1 Tax=Roseibium algae TaxID=3123038 RepID=A0ABU8TIH1_9HYPH